MSWSSKRIARSSGGADSQTTPVLSPAATATGAGGGGAGGSNNSSGVNNMESVILTIPPSAAASDSDGDGSGSSSDGGSGGGGAASAIWRTRVLMIVGAALVLGIFYFAVPEWFETAQAGGVSGRAEPAAAMDGSAAGESRAWTIAPPVTPHSQYDAESLNYTVMIDAGSSGSRVYVYSYVLPRSNDDATSDPPIHAYDVLDVQLLRSRTPLPAPPAASTGRGANPLLDSNPTAEFVVKKTAPGISSFQAAPADAWKSLVPLIDFARANIPESKIASTPLFVMATAGMRMLPPDRADAVLNAIRSGARAHGAFSFTSDSQVSIISGQMEGIYGWMALNDALRRWKYTPATHTSTAGLIELGGASAQIAFELTADQLPQHADLPDELTATVDLNLPCTDRASGRVAPPANSPALTLTISTPMRQTAAASAPAVLSNRYHLYVHSFLGFGANVARKRHMQQLAEAAVVAPAATTIADVCMLKGQESSITLPGTEGRTYKLSGTGDFDKCVESIKPLLKSDVCPNRPSSLVSAAATSKPHFSGCSFDGIRQPALSSYPADAILPAETEFFAFSEFWYAHWDLFGLSGSYEWSTFESTSRAHCAGEWNSLWDEHTKGRHPNADEDRIKMQCFKASWMSAVLHESGFGFDKSQPGIACREHDRGPNGCDFSVPPLPSRSTRVAITPIQTLPARAGGGEIQWTQGAVLALLTDRIRHLAVTDPNALPPRYCSPDTAVASPPPPPAASTSASDNSGPDSLRLVPPFVAASGSSGWLLGVVCFIVVISAAYYYYARRSGGTRTRPLPATATTRFTPISTRDDDDLTASTSSHAAAAASASAAGHTNHSQRLGVAILHANGSVNAHASDLASHSHSTADSRLGRPPSDELEFANGRGSSAPSPNPDAFAARNLLPIPIPAGSGGSGTHSNGSTAPNSNRSSPGGGRVDDWNDGSGIDDFGATIIPHPQTIHKLL